MMMFRIVAKTQAQETAAYVTTKQPWVWVAGLILNIIVVTIFFFANRHEFSWVEGSFTAWYIAFMVWSLILLVVRVYIAGFVHKFFNALQSVGDDRAKELGEHSNYDQKCVVVP